MTTNYRKSSSIKPNDAPSRFWILPVLYGAEFINTGLKTLYHHNTKHFYEKFCFRNYFAFDLGHKLAFHPMRILFDEVT